MAEELTRKLDASLTKRKSLGISRRKRVLQQDKPRFTVPAEADSSSPPATSAACNISFPASPITQFTLENTKSSIFINTPQRTTSIKPCHIQNTLIPCETENDQGLSFRSRKSSQSVPSLSTCSTSTSSTMASGPASAHGASPRLASSPYSATYTATPTNRSRSGLHRSQTKRFKSDFKPHVAVGADAPCKADTDEEMTSLKEESLKLEKEINSLKKEGLSEGELQFHMKKMHEYNELKDLGQMLLGKIAVCEGVTTKDLYGTYGLHLED